MSDVGGVLIHQRRRVVEIVDVFARYGFTQLASAVGAVIVMIVIGLIHGWIGPWPFGGA